MEGRHEREISKSSAIAVKVRNSTLLKENIHFEKKEYEVESI